MAVRYLEILYEISMSCTVQQYSFIVWLADADRNHIKAQNEKVNIWKKCLKAERYIECSMTW